MLLRNAVIFVMFQRWLAMDQDSHRTAEKELVEAVSKITTVSITSPSNEEQSHPKAEISCQVREEIPGKDDLQG